MAPAAQDGVGEPLHPGDPAAAGGPASTIPETEVAASRDGGSWTAKRIALALVAAVVVIWLLVKAVDDPRRFLQVTVNGTTLAALYFVVASGFTLIFGLMRVVNMAHGSLYLLGGARGRGLERHLGGLGERHLDVGDRAVRRRLDLLDQGSQLGGGRVGDEGRPLCVGVRSPISSCS